MNRIEKRIIEHSALVKAIDDVQRANKTTPNTYNDSTLGEHKEAMISLFIKELDKLNSKRVRRRIRLFNFIWVKKYLFKSAFLLIPVITSCLIGFNRIDSHNRAANACALVTNKIASFK